MVHTTLMAINENLTNINKTKHPKKRGKKGIRGKDPS
jgi:ATP:corrinoid adenosyltransferase